MASNLPMVMSVSPPSPITLHLGTGETISLVHASSSNSGNESDRGPPVGERAAAKLFVGGLTRTTSKEMLREYFQLFGTITDVTILMHPASQGSQGFGFITFADSSSVDRVLALANHVIDGKRVVPSRATPNNEAKGMSSRNHAACTIGIRTCRIFVRGVSQDTTTDEVKAYFSQFGRVADIVMLMDPQAKQHKGFVFVTFDSEDVVDQICGIRFHTIKGKKVECNKAQSMHITATVGPRRIGAFAGGYYSSPLSRRMPPGPAVTGIPPGLAVGNERATPTSIMAAPSPVVLAAIYRNMLSSRQNISRYRYTPYSGIQRLVRSGVIIRAQVPPQSGQPHIENHRGTVDLSAFQRLDLNSVDPNV